MHAVTIRFVRQLVIVVSDLYFAAGAALPASREASARDIGRLRGLTSLTRFGALEELPRGWRSWLAASLGREDLAAASPGAVAAHVAALSSREFQTEAWAWLADPLHLTASLTSVHLGPDGLLRLDEPDQVELCRAFAAAFAESGYALVPTRSGRFLAIGPAPPDAVRTMDPARCLGSTITDAIPQGRAAGALRRLGAEIEMWLHEHPLNARRERAGRPPISTLWLWGGGPPVAPNEGKAVVRDEGKAIARGEEAAFARDRSRATILIGDDPYVEGLSHLVGLACEPAACSLASVASTPERAVVQLELFSGGTDAQTGGTSVMPIHSIEALDRAWIEPALERLARRELERLEVVANDRRVSMRPRDRWKRWRRPRAALAALAAPAAPVAPVASQPS